MRASWRASGSADDPVGVIGPCIGDYLNRLADTDAEEHPLFDLTRHLVGTFDVTLASIRARMEVKHQGKPDAATKIESSVRNSLMRSAGTNYQGLVSFAIARYLNSVHSCWFVQHPVPKEFGKTLAIRFSQGLLAEPVPDDPDAPPPPDDEPEEPEGASVDVDPDVDILVRNAAWNGEDGGNEPVL